MTTAHRSHIPTLRPDFGKLAVHFGPLLLAVATFLLVYGVEIFSFGISIDEEAASFHGEDKGSSWLQQGRWAMALLAFVLPPFEAIPLLSTLLFGAGLVFSAWRAFHDFSLSRLQSCFFAAVYVGFPVWLHIAQFSTLAAGFGFGIAAAALGGGAVASGHRAGLIRGALLIGFATAVYQTLALYALVYIVCCLHATPRQETTQSGDERTTRAAPLAQILKAGLGWFSGLMLYLVVQKASLALSGQQISYINSFIQLDSLRANPLMSLGAALDYFRSLAMGTNATYLFWGAGILFLPWVGLLPLSLFTDARRARTHFLEWLGVLAVCALCVAIIMLPIILSASSLPLRAHVAFPLLAAWLASRCGTSWAARVPLLTWSAILYFVVVAGSIGSSLFYVDQVVRRADAALTARLVPAIQQKAGNLSAAQHIPVIIVGVQSFKFDGQFQRAELFGTSFYEHDAGNIYRVVFYMRLLGVTGIQPVRLLERPAIIPIVKDMPIWPAEESVKLVDGVVVVKLSEPTPEQLKGS